MTSPTVSATAQIEFLFRRISTAAFYEELLQEFGISSGGGIYDLPLVIWMMIMQRLSQKGTAAAVVQEMAHQANQPGPKQSWDCKRVRDCKVSSNIGGYCQARKNLPTPVVNCVNEQIFELLRQQTAANEPCRPVYVVDGTTIRLPHNKELVRDYPPGRNQHGENHWPIQMLVTFHDAHTGLAAPPSWGPKYGSKAISEQELAKQALDRLPADAIVLGDGNFGVFFFVHAVQQSLRPVVARLTAVRAKSLLRQTNTVVPDAGARVEVRWTPSCHERKAHPDLPADASLQGWIVVSQNPAKPAEKLYLITTLDWEPDRVIAVYKLRWNIETDLRSLKQTVNLQRITSKSSGVVEKELLIAFTAYNLVRAVIYLAACRENLPPRHFSFSLSQNAVMAAWRDLHQATTEAAFDLQMDLLLKFVAKAKLPQRPNRPGYPREIWGRGGHFPFRPSTPIQEPTQ